MPSDRPANAGHGAAHAGPSDHERINIWDEYEVRYWTRALGCTPELLRIAVNTVGIRVESVRDYLAH